METINAYQQAAHLYDLDMRDIAKRDIPFYQSYVEAGYTHILELACGTGRVSIELAKMGACVDGLDLSDAMLVEFYKKIFLLEPKIQSRIRLIKADMANFELDSRYSLIIAPFRSFQGLFQPGQAERALDSIHAHLEDNGLFIVNTFKPYDQLDQTWVYEKTVQWEAVDPRTGNTVIKYHQGTAIDVDQQIIYPEFFYHEITPDKKESVINEKLALKYYYYSQLKELFQAHGFLIKEEYGYYDKSDIANGTELIFVCSK